MLAPPTFKQSLYRFGSDFRKACWNAFHHNAFGNAKAAAYSAVLSIFPALLAVTTLLTLAPDAPTFLGEIRFAFGQILPPDTMLLVQNYFEPTHGRSLRLILIASSITLFAAMGLMLSLMEGLRRAYLLPRDAWRFWHQRIISALLVPGTLVPMIFATILVAFGHTIEHWMVQNADHELRSYVLFIWRIIRWTIALATSIVVLGVIYHFGIPRRLHWRRSVPGAILATAAWFFATLLYGWYVTRFAHYRIVYGSLGAVVATMVWLYIVSFTILIGGEFNAQRSGIYAPSHELSPCLLDDLPIASPREHPAVSIE
jgi:membrane protein